MRIFAVTVSLAMAAFAAFAGTALPPVPVSALSSVDAVVDTTFGHSQVAAADSALDTVLMGWGLSPFPGIFLNTKPLSGLMLLIR